MKKIISVLLAIVMCFTMTSVAFAEETKDETDVSKDSIMAVLLEAAKIASQLNDEAREKLSEELKGMIIGEVAGDSAFLGSAAEWIIDKILEASGAENILDINKEQAEKLADLLMKLYDGDIAEAIDNPFLKIVVKLIPKEVMKEIVVWFLSDGFGDALKDFIDKYGDGETTEDVKDEKPTDGGYDSVDIAIALQAFAKAIKDVFNELMETLMGFFGSVGTEPAPAE